MKQSQKINLISSNNGRKRRFTHAVLFKIDREEIKKYHKDCLMWARFASKAKGFLGYHTMKRVDYKNQYASVYSWKTKKDHNRFMDKFHDCLVEKSKAKVKTLGYYNLENV